MGFDPSEFFYPVHRPHRNPDRRKRDMETMLDNWGCIVRCRDAMILAALREGIGPREIQRRTGVARTTIARIIEHEAERERKAKERSQH